MSEETFTDIYVNNGFKGKESVSGQGSDLTQTAALMLELPNIIEEFDIKTMLDIPCGDFYWMQNIDLDVDYIGADIVPNLVIQNKKYETKNISFRHLDLITSDLYEVDLIFCRDCLVHLSFRDILKALDNIKRSKSKYLLTTTFHNRTDNKDIVTGQWRTLNLLLEPFNFKEPIELINEQCTENNNQYRDKSMGLWKIND